MWYLMNVVVSSSQVLGHPVASCLLSPSSNCVLDWDDCHSCGQDSAAPTWLSQAWDPDPGHSDVSVSGSDE